MSETRKIITEIIAKTIKGTSFVAVRNYTNSKGEISNQTFLVGANYETAKQADIETVRNFDISPVISDQLDESIILQAKAAILKSLQNPSKSHSEAQANTYEYIGPGLKRHIENDTIHLVGFAIAKKVIEPGVYPHVNSRILTIAKKELTKAMNLKTAKYRNFKLGNAEELKMQGATI